MSLVSFYPDLYVLNLKILFQNRKLDVGGAGKLNVFGIWCQKVKSTQYKKLVPNALKFTY
jgi:hypothetical protein